jgi:hypothetical protein
MISSFFLIIAILEKRIPADAILATQCHPMRFALREPFMDAFNLYSHQLAGLLRR